MGQITKIEQVWNDNNPRWHVPDDPDVAAIREEDTDWNRWLLGKPYVPFDPWKYFEFRIFRDYSGGITSQWMSHGAGLVHFYTDTAIPDSMVANGGIFGWPDIRQNPDTFQALATYDDAKLIIFLYIKLCKHVWRLYLYPRERRELYLLMEEKAVRDGFLFPNTRIFREALIFMKG